MADLTQAQRRALAVEGACRLLALTRRVLDRARGTTLFTAAEWGRLSRDFAAADALVVEAVGKGTGKRNKRKAVTT